ncbi:competence protein ComEA [Streptococcus saliviloxodontae]|uniref:Competence protein ComEA n=2 Tax=Streptococcus saliviloxodontae TaxID=1349416 RepID=A0ABS2PP39_9STRE|nr:competence protein ComEA [Streptococcus saliviloxodontae]
MMMLEDMIEKLKPYKYYAVLLLILIGISTCLVLKLTEPKEVTSFPEVAQSQLSSVSSSSSASSSEPVSEKTIFVDIKGAVAKEGVYELPSGSRLTDLVKKAGGLTADAERRSINLAQKLNDEDAIIVAKQGEQIISDQQSPLASPSESDESSKINLNKATLADLQTISGIGAKRAQDILDFRESRGGFKSVEDLKNVSGIGDKTLEKLKDEVTVD